MRAFVASASSEHKRALACADLLRKGGVQVTSKEWPRQREAKAKSAADKLTLATAELAEVDACQFLLLLLPTGATVSAGAWVTLGYAKHAGKHVVAAGVHYSAYVGLADEVYPDDQSAVAALLAHAELRAPDLAHAELPAVGTPVSVRVEHYVALTPDEKVVLRAGAELRWSFVPNDRSRGDDLDLSVKPPNRVERLVDTWTHSRVKSVDTEARTVTFSDVLGTDPVLLAGAVNADWRYA